jgi:hypothetical protein
LVAVAVVLGEQDLVQLAVLDLTLVFGLAALLLCVVLVVMEEQTLVLVLLELQILVTVGWAAVLLRRLLEVLVVQVLLM